MTTIQRAYDLYSKKKRFPLPSEAQVAALERKIKVSFPEDYRQFLLEFNGGFFKCPEITPTDEGCPIDTLHFMYGLGASHESAELGRPASLALFDDNDPPQIMPIGRTGSAGLIVLDVGQVEGRGAIYLKVAFGDFYYLIDEIEPFFALLRDPTWEINAGLDDDE